MRILSLVEDWTARDDLKRTHGMCLYIETAQHKILFDVGPDDTFMQNAEACGVFELAPEILEEILEHVRIAVDFQERVSVFRVCRDSFMSPVLVKF